MSESKLLRPDDVGQILQVAKPRVYELTRRGELPVVLIGERQYRYRPEDVARYVESRVVKGSDSELDEVA